jgi:C-terminal processing protease CtpA/Prc
MSVPRDFAGSVLQLRGWLRTRDVTGFAGLWLREDGRGGSVQFDNMQDRGVSGTTAWTQYTVTLPLDDRARRVFFGALVAGEGTMWVDDLELLVDGVPAWEAPRFEFPVVPSELDTEFDEGSRIAARDISNDAVDRLALLGRVWGFVKYHHAHVRSGQINWDYELLRVLPSVLEASDSDEALAAMASWLSEIGDPAPCDPCARPTLDPHLQPEIDWIRDRELLGEDLSQTLQRMHERRPASVEPYYVGFMPNVGNPDFSSEPDYRTVTPDAGFRLLGLYRFWNIIEYWFPYRNLIDGSWEDVLVEFLPRVMRETTGEEYRLLMQELSVRVEDTHANVAAAMALRPPRGPAELPIIVRFVAGQAVVTGHKDVELGQASGLRVGDVIERLDGRPVAELLEEWRPYYSASNEAARLRDMGRILTRGTEGPVEVSGSRADGDFALTATRVPSAVLDPMAGRWHDLPGETFQMLSEDVAYVKLSSVVAADATSYIERAAEADVLVVDIRNYPGQFVPFALGGHFVEEPTPFASFTVADPANPGAFRWVPPVVIQPLTPTFRGRVVVLVDEVSLSQAEYTAMALRSAPRAIVAGSTTAGADGNVSPIPLPGGINSLISGIGVFYPDRSPTQQIGIVPDLEIRPTIEGIRAGRDEVLEEAVSTVLGREFRLTQGLQ